MSRRQTERKADPGVHKEQTNASLKNKGIPKSYKINIRQCLKRSHANWRSPLRVGKSNCQEIEVCAKKRCFSVLNLLSISGVNALTAYPRSLLCRFLLAPWDMLTMLKIVRIRGTQIQCMSTLKIKICNIYRSSAGKNLTLLENLCLLVVFKPF